MAFDIKSYYGNNKQTIITVAIIIATLGGLYFLAKKFVFTTFDDFINVIFKNEGYFSDNKDDTGGATLYGLSAVYNPEYANEILSKTLTKSDAKLIYKKKYYDPLHIGLINNAKLRFSIFDMAVNAGVSTGVKLLQKIIGVPQDANLTSSQVTRVNQLDEAGYNVLGKYKQARKEYYSAIIARKPSQEQFRKGWMNRVDSDAKLFT